MTSTIIIIFCSLLLVAYLFNLTSEKTRIPSVILLLVLGWGIKQSTNYFEIDVPDFSTFLPILATIGLVLIVLEGSLELELSKSKLGKITKSALGALMMILALAFTLAYSFHYFGGYSLRSGLINAIPLCIISSAVVIPSAVNLVKETREFIIYESSISDIMGVLFFNFVMLNEAINLTSFGHFGLQLIIMISVSIVCTIALSLLLHHIDHEVKFVPIILLLILIFAVSEHFHLPALIFILIFGLTIGNMDQFKRFEWYKKSNIYNLKKEIQRFKDLTIEGAFLIRALFFILFGFLIDTSDVVNPETFVWSISLVALILMYRFIQLKLSGMHMRPLLFIAPRGLITILLFLSIGPDNSIYLVNKSLIIQVILLTALIMTFALIVFPNEHAEELQEGSEDVVADSE